MAAKTADEAEERAFGYRLIRILQPTPSMALYALIGAKIRPSPRSRAIASS